MKKHENLKGKKFNKLTVIKWACGVWECKCDCGGIRYATSSQLKKGNITSCGCTSTKKSVWHGCGEDCFNCQYDDCVKPGYLCGKVPEVAPW